MMPEAQLLRRALSGELPALMRVGLNAAILREPYDEVFTRLVDFYQKHNELPSEGRFFALCDDIVGWELPPAERAPSKGSVYWEQISDAVLKYNFQSTMQGIINRYNDKTTPATELCLEGAAQLRRIYVEYGVGETKPVAASHVEPVLWNDYQMAAAGHKPGIPINPVFPNLANGIVTWAPASITTVVSRGGVGKTWFLLINGLYAACMGYKMIVASMEMTDEDIVERMIALHTRIDYDALTKGRLMQDQFDRYQACRKAIQADEPPWCNIRFMNPDSIRSVEAVEAQADALGCHLVLADAFYDIQESTKEKDWEKITENLRAVRRYSLSTKRHWMLTAQFSKAAKTSYDSDEFAVGGTDYFNKISNNVVMLIQTKDQRKARHILIKLSKARKAPPQPMYDHHWNFCVPTWEPVKAVHERSKKNEQNRSYA